MGIWRICTAAIVVLATLTAHAEEAEVDVVPATAEANIDSRGQFYLQLGLGLGGAVTWGFYEAPEDYHGNFRGAALSGSLRAGFMATDDVAVYASIAPRTLLLASDNLSEDTDTLSSGLWANVALIGVGGGTAWYSPDSHFYIAGNIHALYRQVEAVREGSLFDDDARDFVARDWGAELEVEVGNSVPVSSRVAFGAFVNVGGHVVPSENGDLQYGFHIIPGATFALR